MLFLSSVFIFGHEITLRECLLSELMLCHEFVKNMETLEFIIYPNGHVQEQATGMVGNYCTVLTAAIEDELGVVVNQRQTSEYFADLIQERSDIVDIENIYSNW